MPRSRESTHLRHRIPGSFGIKNAYLPLQVLKADWMAWTDAAASMSLFRYSGGIQKPSVPLFLQLVAFFSALNQQLAEVIVRNANIPGIDLKKDDFVPCRVGVPVQVRWELDRICNAVWPSGTRAKGSGKMGRATVIKLVTRWFHGEIHEYLNEYSLHRGVSLQIKKGPPAWPTNSQVPPALQDRPGARMMFFGLLLALDDRRGLNGPEARKRALWEHIPRTEATDDWNEEYREMLESAKAFVEGPPPNEAKLRSLRAAAIWYDWVQERSDLLRWPGAIS